jgi:hypothetical protein
MLALCAPAMAQEPVPPPPVTVTTPEIKGVPKLTAPGQELRLSVVGLTTPPLSDGIGRLQEWSSKVELLIDAPDGVEAVADTDLSLGLGAQAVRFRIFFTPPSGGVYVLILHDKNAGTVVTKRITVGPVVPDPNPPGPQPPVPVVGGKRVAMFIHEASEMSPDVNILITKLRDGSSAQWIKDKGHSLLILDKDQKEMGKYQATLETEGKKGTPRLVVLDQATNTVLLSESFDGDNPDTVVELIKRTGG